MRQFVINDYVYKVHDSSKQPWEIISVEMYGGVYTIRNTIEDTEEKVYPDELMPLSTFNDYYNLVN